MDALLQDVRYAARTLIANPGFALLTILCLSVGIGVNGAIFSVADSVALRPMPFADAERLVSLQGTRPADGVDRSTVTYHNLAEWHERTRSFAAIAGASWRDVTITARGESVRISGAAITANLFTMLGVAPIAGRGFTPADDRPEAARVVMLGHGLWTRRYSGDPAIVGTTIVLDALPHTVIGVMPARFAFPEIADLWVALAPVAHTTGRDERRVRGYARLAPGVSMAMARSDLAAAAGQLASAYREYDGWSATVIPLREELIPNDARLMALTMLAAVMLVLFVACANVANLLLARSTARQREIAVRAALGAGRPRIVRQLLTESTLIALLSVPLGTLLAYVGLGALTAAVPVNAGIPYYIDWSMNGRVLVYIGGVALATGVLFGLAPALQAADGTLHRALKDGGRGTAASASRARTRNLLIVCEIAVSLVLLVGASLLVRTFVNLQSADLGFDPGPLMTAKVFMAGDRYRDEPARLRAIEQLVQRVEALPGVDAAFASNFVPLNSGGGWSRMAGDTVTPVAGREPEGAYFAVTAGALRTLGVTLSAGRDFRSDEAHTRAPVAIVNRTLASRLFPGSTDVIGRRVRLLDESSGGGAPGSEWLTIIGVTGDMRVWNVREDEPTPFAFVPYPYMPSPETGLSIRMRSGAPSAVTPALRAVVRELDPELPLFELLTGEEHRALNFWDSRLFGWMFAIFGAVALLLAAIGTYGVLSYSVAQRTQEIGVRMALGAARADVFALVLGQAARLAAWGVGVGLVLALGATQAIRVFLYQVTATDPVSFVATAVFLVVVALLAAYLPARRATSIDPLVALRAE